MEWLPADSGILEADVVRWEEAIWAPKRRRRQNRPWGSQEVIGQVTALDAEYVSIKVMKAEITENNIAAELKPHRPGTVIRKKRVTLQKGGVQRMSWSDEGARSAALREKKPPH